MKDRKGGCITMLHQKAIDISFTKWTQLIDFLYVHGTLRGWDLKMVAVYFNANDRSKKLSMKAETEKLKKTTLKQQY